VLLFLIPSWVAAQFSWYDSENESQTSIESFAIQDTTVWIVKDQSIIRMNTAGTIEQMFFSYQLPVPYDANLFGVVIDTMGSVRVSYQSLGGYYGYNGYSAGIIVYDDSVWINFQNTGLPSLSYAIHSNLVKDSSSQLWMTFGELLCKFDGSTWTNFSCSQLAYDEYFTSIQFQNDTLLLCTWAGKVISFTDGNFNLKYQLSGSIIKVDKKNNIWICGSAGLFRISNSVIDTFNNGNSPLQYECDLIAFDSLNRLYYFGKYNGLYYVFNDTTWTSYISPISDPYYIQGEILFDSFDRIWFGYKGLNIFKLETGAWNQYDIFVNQLPSENILAVNGWDPWNELAYAVIGTDNGFAGVGNYFSSLALSFFYDSLNSMLNSNTITCLAHSFSYPYIQAIGTCTGLYLFYPDSNKMIHFDKSNSDLPNDTINYVLNNYDNFWIATNGGVAILDLSFNWTVLDTSNTPLPSNHVNSIFRKNLYPWGYFICTQNGVGIFSYPDSTWKVLNTTNSGLPENDVVAMYYNWSDYMLFGTRSSGVADSLLDSTWVYFNTGNGVPSDSITFIGPGTFLIGGDTWIGTKGGGLVYFQDGSYLGNINNVSGIDFRNANDAAFSPNFEHSTAWVATDKGLLFQDFGYGVPSISNYQFPLSGYFNGNNLIANYTLPLASSSTIELFDIVGRRIATSKQTESLTNKRVQLTIPYLSVGLYIVTVIAGNLRQSVKIFRAF